MVTISKKARYVYLILLIYLWFRNHAYKKVTSYAIISLICAYVLTFFIKIFNYSPRPFLKHSVRLLPPVPSKRNASFPSKHTTIAFAVATSVLFYQRSIGFFMWILAMLSGFSRIWMGQHYPSDILGSAILGSVIASVVNLVKSTFNPIVNRVLCVCSSYKD
jgi:undecaprenyl-diphosphatase